MQEESDRTNDQCRRKRQEHFSLSPQALSYMQGFEEHPKPNTKQIKSQVLDAINQAAETIVLTVLKICPASIIINGNQLAQ
jgi:hypothetical protein